MKELVNNDLSKLSILLQQTKKGKLRDRKEDKHFSIKKINSNKVYYTSFYKPISRIL
jgi:hypothetical protein